MNPTITWSAKWQVMGNRELNETNNKISRSNIFSVQVLYQSVEPVEIFRVNFRIIYLG